MPRGCITPDRQRHSCRRARRLSRPPAKVRPPRRDWRFRAGQTRPRGIGWTRPAPITGTDPATGALNRHLHNWHVSQLFVPGASAAAASHQTADRAAWYRRYDRPALTQSGRSRTGREREPVANIEPIISSAARCGDDGCPLKCERDFGTKKHRSFWVGPPLFAANPRRNAYE
jgi:hypothetical protein